MARGRDPRPARLPVPAAHLSAAALALVAAVLFGITVVAQRALAVADVPALSVVGLRYAVAALVLLAYLGVRRKPLMPVAGERLRAVGLGAGGYALQAVLFYLALGRGSAGTVAILFYVYPALVLGLEVAMGRTRPGAVFVLAVLLTCAGAGAVLGAGHRVDVSAGGAALALASAGCIAVYLVVNARLLPRSGAAAAAAWVSLGTAASTLALASTSGLPTLRSEQWQWLLVAGVTTGAATACMYAALALAPASRVAVVLALQTLVALGLAALLLAEAVRPAHLLGGATIIAAAAVATRARERPAPP